MMKNTTTFEELLVFHCAPTLSGIKAASLMSCCGALAEETPYLLDAYNQQADHKGIRFILLCRWPQRCLVLVYRPELLEKVLHQPGAKALLQKQGYPAEANTQELLSYLGQRIAQGGEFPHEIGVFLDYPLDDVQGFIQHKGQNFKLCGYWKVYSDEHQANALFHKYTRCREILTKRLGMGVSILQLISAA